MEVHMTFPVSQAIQYDSGKEKPNIWARRTLPHDIQTAVFNNENNSLANRLIDIRKHPNFFHQANKSCGTANNRNIVHCTINKLKSLTKCYNPCPCTCNSTTMETEFFIHRSCLISMYMISWNMLSSVLQHESNQQSTFTIT